MQLNVLSNALIPQPGGSVEPIEPPLVTGMVSITVFMVITVIVVAAGCCCCCCCCYCCCLSSSSRRFSDDSWLRHMTHPLFYIFTIPCSDSITLIVSAHVVSASQRINVVLLLRVVVVRWLVLQFGEWRLHRLLVSTANLSRPAGGICRVAGPLTCHEEPHC